MSSGVGFFTDKGRCYNRWVEFIRCKDSTSLPFQDCVHQMEDYQECLHHRKEAKIISVDFIIR